MVQQLSPTRRDVLKSGGALIVTFVSMVLSFIRTD